MPDCPPANRGSCFPTHLSARNLCWHPCLACHGCQNYCAHSAICTNCLERVPPDMRCNHTPEQENIIRHLTNLTRQPMFHPDQKPGEVQIDVDRTEELENLARELDPTGKGRIVPLPKGG